LLIAAKIWPTDLTKVYAALETIVLVVYPNMEADKVEAIAKIIDPNTTGIQ